MEKMAKIWQANKQEQHPQRAQIAEHTTVGKRFYNDLDTFLRAYDHSLTAYREHYNRISRNDLSAET
jgi:hypothetical protein